MPGFDATGPAGTGPMSGAGRGACATDDPKIVTRFFQRAVGCGLGPGRRPAMHFYGRGMGLRLGRGCGR